jgi:hypothetical protein
MEQLREHIELTKESSSSNGFTLAITVGFLTFLVAGELPGGLTAVQGFFVGFLATMFLLVLLGLLALRQPRWRVPEETRSIAPGDVSVRQMETENGVIIQIRVSTQPGSTAEAARDPRL